MTNNYTANGFMADPNAGFGRNAGSDILKVRWSGFGQMVCLAALQR